MNADRIKDIKRLPLAQGFAWGVGLRVAERLRFPVRNSIRTIRDMLVVMGQRR